MRPCCAGLPLSRPNAMIVGTKQSMSTSPIRLVFLGTPELARTILVSLSDTPGLQLLAVGCQPDRPSGRHLQPTAPPVKTEAVARNLPVLQPARAGDPQFLAQLRELHPDLIVVAAYGQLLPPALLEIPRLGCLNVHTSLLPRWRGAAPIQWAIASGDAETGVTLMKMDAGLDTGPILRSATTPITADDTGQTLHDRLATLGGDLLRQIIPDYAAGRLIPHPQPTEGVTYARKITRADGRIEWSQPAGVLFNRLRAFTPWPGAFCFLPGAPRPRLLKVHQARPEPGERETTPGTVIDPGPQGLVVACGKGSLRLTEVQLEGGRRLSAAEFLAGHSVSHLE